VSAAGRTLILNTLAFATGASTKPSTPTLSITRDGNNLSLTFSGGTLQSADSVGGPWKDEAGASPLKIQTTGSAKFFRVKGA